MFAQFLGQADDVLNAKGGTDIFQLSPARVSLTQGHEHLACMRLTPKGLRRWYASCCNTPIGNTLANAKPPFLGLIHNFTDHTGEGRSRDATAGPVRAHVNGRVGFAGDDGQPLGFLSKTGMLWHSVKLLFGSWIRREHRPSEFFDDGGAPRVSATVLDQADHAKLKQEVEARTTDV